MVVVTGASRQGLLLVALLLWISCLGADSQDLLLVGTEDGDEIQLGEEGEEGEQGARALPAAFLPIPLKFISGDITAVRHLRPPSPPGTEVSLPENAPEWNEFGGELDGFLDEELEPGGWKQTLDDIRGIARTNPPGSGLLPLAISAAGQGGESRAALAANDTNYRRGLEYLLEIGVTSRNLTEAARLFHLAADDGHCHAQSALGFLHASGYGVPMNEAKAFLYHSFASRGGSFQSRMALGYSYLRQQDFDAAADMYARVAAKTVVTNHVKGEAPLVETVRLTSHKSTVEESEEAVRGHRGEDDETIQYVVYTASKGNVNSLRVLGSLYYWGARGLPKDPVLSFHYFRRAAEVGDVYSMVNLGAMLGRGVGVETNYSLSLKWFHEAAKHEGEAATAALNGLGILYARGLGVRQNYTEAQRLFRASASKGDSEGQYYLGLMYFHGLGVPKNHGAAFRFFAKAAERNHLASVYWLAKMNHKGMATPQNSRTAAILYKTVAEAGPWGSLFRWAHSLYMEGEIGTSLLLYSRAAEVGYEVAQANAAWLLDKCSERERHERSHRLWRHASEQGNVQAALLIGDAYYYGRGTNKDLERAASAYIRAKERRSAQAMFNLAFMHQQGRGVPKDLFLAKRYYDEARAADVDAALPVTLALVTLLDALVDLVPKLISWSKPFHQDDANVTLLTLLLLLLGVLYLRHQRVRRTPLGTNPTHERAPPEHPVEPAGVNPMEPIGANPVEPVGVNHGGHPLGDVVPNADPPAQ